MKELSTSAAAAALREKVVARGTASGTDCYVAKASVATLTDMDGRQFIDFAGGIAVMNVGHSHPKVVDAITRQAQAFTHTCFMVSPYASAVSLADKLCAGVPGDFPKAAMFANSGAEAVENAVKIARYHTGRQGVIAFENGFHGRTLLTMSLTSKVKPYKLGFGPFAPEVYRAPFAYCYRCPVNLEYPSCNAACADGLTQMFETHVAPENVAAVIMEPVQGEGGFIVPPKEFVQKIRAACDAHGILLIADEIQTGMARTGTLFAMEQLGVIPDLTCVAKSLAAGMPLSAVVGKKEIMDSVHVSGIGGTYGGNPVACAAALAVFDIVEQEDLLGTAQNLGSTLTERLNQFYNEFDLVGDVRGLGPMAAMELVEDRKTKVPAAQKTKELVRYCYERGLILLACGIHGNVIRFLMPLVISTQELEQGLDILHDGLKSVQG